MFPKSDLHTSWETVSWAKQHGSELRGNEGTSRALVTLSNVEGIGEAVVAPDITKCCLVFSCHYLIGQIPLTALTQQCLSPQQSGDIISIASGPVTAKWRQAGLLLLTETAYCFCLLKLLLSAGSSLLRDSCYCNDLLWVWDLCSVCCTCQLFRECFSKLTDLFFHETGTTCTGKIGPQVAQPRRNQGKKYFPRHIGTMEGKSWTENFLTSEKYRGRVPNRRSQYLNMLINS